MEKRLVCFALKEMNNLIRRKIDQEARKEKDGENGCDNMGRSAIQRWIIEFVFANKDKDVFQRDIEKQFSIRRSTATSVLKTMEKNGMIVRCASSEDGRLKKITLTTQSIEKCSEIRKTIDGFERKITDGIDERELEVFFGVMDKFKQNLKK